MSTGVDRLIKITVLLSYYFIVFVNSDQANDECVIKNSDEKGQCVQLEDCPNATIPINLNELPQLCDSQKYPPKICCPLKSLQIPGALSRKKCKDIYSRNRPEHIEKIIGGGGRDSDAQEFPHMAALGYGHPNNVSWNCGGSLISERFVLTAAHCIEHPLIGNVKYVRLGDLDLRRNDDVARPQNFTVKRTIVHPLYKPLSVYHDIALIELDKNITEDEFVRPACLQVDKNISSSFWLASGWGTTSFGGDAADHLQVVVLRPFPHKDCDQYYNSSHRRRLRNGIDDDTQICAGDRKQDTCPGDSGGPLQFRNQYYRGYNIIGITSFGKGCVTLNVPGVYTRVSSYIEWIESSIWG